MGPCLENNLPADSIQLRGTDKNEFFVLYAIFFFFLGGYDAAGKPLSGLLKSSWHVLKHPGTFLHLLWFALHDLTRMIARKSSNGDYEGFTLSYIFLKSPSSARQTKTSYHKRIFTRGEKTKRQTDISCGIADSCNAYYFLRVRQVMRIALNVVVSGVFP